MKLKILLFIIFLNSIVFATTLDKKTIETLRDHTKDHHEKVEKNSKLKFSPSKIQQEKKKKKTFNSNCMNIKKINITGNRKFKESQLDKITKDYENRCISLNEIQEILDKITKLYHDNGHITSKANLILDKKGKKDEIIIKIFEGKIKDIHYKTNDKNASSLNTPLPFLKETILSVQDLDQGIEQINRLESMSSKFDIEPSKEGGYSTIVVKSTEKGTIRPSLAYRNSGRNFDDAGDLIFSTDIDNSLNMFDKISLSYQEKTDDESEKYNRTSSGSLTIPLGYWTMDFSHSYSKNYSIIEGSSASFSSYGYIKTDSILLKKILYRDSKQKYYGSFYLENRKNGSYINDVLVAISSHQLSTSEIVLGYNYVKGSNITFELKHKWGNGYYFGDGNRDNITDEEANKRFKVYKGKVSLSKTLKDWLNYSFLFQNQKSKHELLSHEQFSTVKGIYEDNGYSIKNSFNFKPFRTFNKYLSPMNFDFGFEYGAVDSVTGDNDDSASVYEAKLNYAYSFLTLNLGSKFGGHFPKNGDKEDEYPEQSVYLQFKKGIF
ncbi:MAG: POTRA domain-containing protein [Campylobacterales bacterium]|nr:POTRA domain-containing protein [Campylobacterales bacterium]